MQPHKFQNLGPALNLAHLKTNQRKQNAKVFGIYLLRELLHAGSVYEILGKYYLSCKLYIGIFSKKYMECTHK
jgi:hypothetical protein